MKKSYFHGIKQIFSFLVGPSLKGTDTAMKRMLFVGKWILINDCEGKRFVRNPTEA